MAKQTPTPKQLYDLLPMHSDISNIIYSYVDNPFIITLDINNTTFVIPRIISRNDIFIDWGDNNKIQKIISDKDSIHVYPRFGEYIVHIFGDIINLSFERVTQLVEISQWGNLHLFNGNKVFYLCNNLTITATDKLNLENVTNLSKMFFGCESLNYDFSKWDVSNIVDMFNMFGGCFLLNTDLSQWDVSNVKNMNAMFAGCETFNSDLSRWNVKNVTDMQEMFNRCKKFTSDLSKWNVSNVTNMSSMFFGCMAFNSDLSKWNVSNVADMYGMFYECISFNSDLSHWDVSNVHNINSMLFGCKAFDFLT